MTKHIHIFIILPLLLITASFAFGMDDTLEEELLRANRAYKSGRFQEAVDGYESVLRSGENGYVLYNLGNAYFKLNNLGKAIVNYERARMLLPRDADLDFNLRYARDQVKDAVPQQQTFVDMAFFWLDGCTPKEIFWGFAVINIFFWGVLLLRIFTKAEWSFYLLLTVLGLWLLSGLSFGVKWHQARYDDRAVIIAEEADVLAGPNRGDTLLFKLHAGTVVAFERSEDGWGLIHLPDKKRGWVERAMFEMISTPLQD